VGWRRGGTGRRSLQTESGPDIVHQQARFASKGSLRRAQQVAILRRLVDNAKFLLRVYWQPGAAMSAILDQGSLLFASLAVLAVSYVYSNKNDPQTVRT